MTFHQIKCEVIDVKTDTGICPGIAKTEKGEQFILGARTPQPKGICTNSLPVLYPMSFAMRLTDKMDWEKQEHFDVVCPHGAVTYRLSRMREDNSGNGRI